MKLKYYLRGVGIGVIVSTIVLTIAFANKKTEISDDEIKLKAALLGMISVEEADELDAKVESLENEKSDLEKQIEELNRQINASVNEEKKLEEETEAEKVEGENEIEVSVQEDQMEENSEVVSFAISRGMGSETVAQILEDNGLVPSAAEFNKYLVNGGYSDMIQVGEYTISRGATFDEIVDTLLSR